MNTMIYHLVSLIYHLYTIRGHILESIVMLKHLDKHGSIVRSELLKKIIKLLILKPNLTH